MIEKTAATPGKYPYKLGRLEEEADKLVTTWNRTQGIASIKSSSASHHHWTVPVLIMLPGSPALGSEPQFAFGGAAVVLVDVQQAGVALLALLHPGVPADVAVALLEAGRRPQPQTLHDGPPAALREQLGRHKVTPLIQQRDNNSSQAFKDRENKLEECISK